MDCCTQLLSYKHALKALIIQLIYVIITKNSSQVLSVEHGNVFLLKKSTMKIVYKNIKRLFDIF